jgi:hypothetical protein
VYTIGSADVITAWAPEDPYNTKFAKNLEPHFCGYKKIRFKDVKWCLHKSNDWYAVLPVILRQWTFLWVQKNKV